MSTLQIYDPALCCSSGVCGQDVDASLVQAAADMAWATRLGARIERFNLAQQPLAFAQNQLVRDVLERAGQASLPITLLDGQLVLAGRYPSRQELGQWLNIVAPATSDSAGSCCNGGKCC